jgi:hypothetical protein
MSPRFFEFARTLVVACVVFNTGCAFAEEPCSLVQLGQTWVDAIPDLSVHARWDQDDTQSATYNPPDGHEIVETAVDVHSEHWGDRSVSTIAGGGSFATSESFDAANEYLANAYGKYGDEAEGKLALRVKSARNYAKKYEANKNTI